MKALIKYSDWLIKIRDKVAPIVGDKLHILSSGITIHNSVVTEQSGATSTAGFNIRVLKHQAEVELFKRLFEKESHKWYVEIDLPEIEWVRDKSSKREMYILCINNIVTCTEIAKLRTKDKFYLYPDFEGTLQECKQKANELLFNKI